MYSKASLSHRNSEPENGVLYVVATPIGNLEDISPRAINILRNVFFIACEDTRITKKLLFKFHINKSLISFNKVNYFNKIPKIIDNLNKGKSIAIVSDAGMPGVCDPGEKLIHNTKLNGLEVICIPGPCAALTALVSSGFPSSKFIFEGFLPRKKIEREKILIQISKNEKSTILYESPHRLNRLLEELKKYCGGHREIEVARELTKKFEEHIGPDIDKVIESLKGKKLIGEFTIVIKGVKPEENIEINKEKLKKELHELINAGLSLSAAAKYLAKKTNVAKNNIYNLY